MSNDIVIPVQRRSKQLDDAVASIEAHTSGHRLIVVEDNGINVSEARQKAMDEMVESRYVCFLDDDSVMVMDGWLDAMMDTMRSHDDAAVVFAHEWWGEEDSTRDPESRNDIRVGHGPAACMLIDRNKVGNICWDANAGLRSGWLGGDFEEVDFCYRVRIAGHGMYRSQRAVFHHTGGRSTMEAFASTDRAKACGIMGALIRLKYHVAPTDDDFFKGLKYVKADPNNDLMLAGGSTLRECYHDVIVRNGLSHVPMFKRMGLV